MATEKRYYGGIQGGASHSDMVILDDQGKCVGTAAGGGTNPWQIGQEKCVQELAKMVVNAKKSAGLDPSCSLESLGMALSGGEQPQIQQKISDELEKQLPKASKRYVVQTDTFGSIATAFADGGMVLISGTGSNCQLLNPSGDSPRCGGWGHMLGDEGGAYWIAHRAIKTVYDHEDGLNISPHDTTVLKSKIFSFFKLKAKFDFLDYVSADKFQKPTIAMFCKELAEVANATGDKLCHQLFFDAGYQLGKHVMALIPQVDPEVTKREGCVPVVAVGSVFNSWSLLKPGFQSAVKSATVAISIYQLTVTSAVGAALIGAKHIPGCKLPIDYNANKELLCRFD